MVKRRISCWLPALLALGLAMALPAEARPTHGGVASAIVGCPFGTSTPDIDNGCSGSPGGSVIHTDFYTSYAAQSGQTLAFRQGRNEPGIDYKIAMPLVSAPGICGKDHIVDPANATVGTGCGQLQTGCSWLVGGQTTYTLGTPTIYCTGATNPTVQGFDLKENGNHGGVVILFNPTTNTGTLTARFNDCQVGANDSQCFYVPVGGSNDVMIYANGMDGGWYNYGSHAGITGSISGTTLTVTAVSYGNLAVNQSVNDGTTGNGGAIVNTFITSQLTGTGGASCPDVTCTGGVGTYLVSKSQTITSQSMTTGWHSVGATLNTTGKISAYYNSCTNFNGRPFQGQRTLSASGPYVQTPTDDFRWNYCDNMVFTFDGGAIHAEMFQGTVASGATGTMLLKHYEGNVGLFGAATFGGGTTSFIYPNTGVPSAQTANTKVELINNVVINNVGTGPSGAVAATALASFGYDSFTDTTIRGNTIYRGTAPYYTNCTNAPYANGVVQKATGTASLNQSPGANTMHVTAFSGSILFQTGWHVFNYDRYITGQLSGTTGQIGDYSLDKIPVTVGSAAVFAQPDAFVNAPVISGNVDPSTGLSIDSQLLVAGSSLSNCQMNTH
jgi:hypothetical protein